MGTAPASVDELAGMGTGKFGVVSKLVEETGALVCARRGRDAKTNAARRRWLGISGGIYFNS